MNLYPATVPSGLLSGDGGHCNIDWAPNKYLLTRTWYANPGSGGLLESSEMVYTTQSAPYSFDWCDWGIHSPDGAYWALARGATPYLDLYKVSGNNYTKITGQPAWSWITNSPWVMAWTKDGNALIAGSTILTRSGDYLTQAGVISMLGSLRGMELSPDGNYLACCGAASPYIRVLKRNSNTSWTQLTISGPTGPQKCVCWSPCGTYLVSTGSTGANTLFIYKRNGDAFDRLTDQPDVPIATSSWTSHCDFSPDGKYLVVSSHPERLLLYRREGDTFTLRPEIPNMPLVSHMDVKFSTDGCRLAVNLYGDPYLYVYAPVPIPILKGLKNGESIDLSW